MRLPGKTVVEEARQIVLHMINQERGPYKRLRWFCADGSVLEPQPYACDGHGGGKQHAEYSDDRQRLAELGWHVGTIFTALKTNTPEVTAGRRLRLRELPLEKYLIDINDGWVLRKARHYRGRVQAEDEEAAGKQLLLKLLQDPRWIEGNFLLFRELLRVVPHHGAGTDLTRSIRRLAKEIAELDPGFELLRIEIHTTPNRSTAGKVREWLKRARGKAISAGLEEKAANLLVYLEQLYGESGRESRLKGLRNRVAGMDNAKDIQMLFKGMGQGSGLQKIQHLGELLSAIRDIISTPLSAGQRLQLLDGMADLEAELGIAASEFLQNQHINRSELINAARHLVMAAYGGGLLSTGEKKELLKRIETVTGARKISHESYMAVSQSLNLTSSWAIGTIRYSFAEALNWYAQLDSRAAGFIDDILRSSPMLRLAEIVRRLNFDAHLLAGVTKTIQDIPAPSMLALNPGIAVGPLRVLSKDEVESKIQLNRDEIVLLPQTVSELPPVAGVMTMGESNMLSHIQLLARNFGIPNVSISPQDIEKLSPLGGRRVIMIAGSDGSVILERFDQMDPRYQPYLEQGDDTKEIKLDVPEPDLDLKRPLPITVLGRELSGVVVGPKAANLGELNRLFPGLVAPAIALPFGIFLDTVNRYDASNWNRLKQVYEKFRRGELDERMLNMELESIRRAVGQVRLTTAIEDELKTMMARLFGPPGSYGLFIRSDTNVEDLPGFTGAGLSKTAANVVGLENQISAIPEIWASVLTPRAVAWRSNLLKQPERIYPSVLLMKSVPVDKSGVLVTADLFTRKSGLTVSTAWGVGGAVEGEATETLLLLEHNNEMLITEAKTPYRRGLSDSGGIHWRPTADGRVLTADEKRQLRRLTREVADRYQPVMDGNGNVMPWDIEFGFLEGGLTLFQIRPLVERGQTRADRIIQVLNPSPRSLPEFVELSKPPLTNTL